MKQVRSRFYNSLILGTVSFLLVLMTHLPIAALPTFPSPSLTSQTSSPIQPLQYVPPPPPGSNRGGPGRQTHTGTRAPCGTATAANGYLTAFIPKTGVALTTSARPTFWAYIPYAMENIETLEFALWQDDDEIITPVRLTLTDDLPGIIHLPLPEQFADLERDRFYQWSLTLYCKSSDESAYPPFVEGSIQRVSPTAVLAQALEEALEETSREQASLYAQNGIWYDALTTLGLLYQNEPDHPLYAADWAALLSVLEIDLRDRGIDFDTGDLLSKPITDCCSTSPNAN